MRDDSAASGFETFFVRVEPRLRLALTATFGDPVGREATLDALLYAWEHWERVRAMENSAGYLYVVGRDRARRNFRRSGRPVLVPVDTDRAPWVEPELPSALAALPEQQRVVVMLLHCSQWTMSEVAELLQISKSTVQTHSERGLTQLRERMGVAL